MPIGFDIKSPKPLTSNGLAKGSDNRVHKKLKGLLLLEEGEVTLDFEQSHEGVTHALNQLLKIYHSKMMEKDKAYSDLMKSFIDRLKVRDEVAIEMVRLKVRLYEAKSWHFKEMQTLLKSSKRNAEIQVLESKIQMAEEAAAHGFEFSACEVDAWKIRLKVLEKSSSS